MRWNHSKNLPPKKNSRIATQKPSIKATDDDAKKYTGTSTYLNNLAQLIELIRSRK
jgi:hypothetical protein